MRSMTSYAQAKASDNNFFCELVLRSNNSKYLEFFSHQLPAEKIYLEERFRREIKKNISRGRIEAFFFLFSKSRHNIAIDYKTLQKYSNNATKVAKQFNLRKEALFSNIFSLPGVIKDQQKYKISDRLLTLIFKEAVVKLNRFREKEGRAIKKDIVKNMRSIESKLSKIKNATNNKGSDIKNKDIAEEVSLLYFYIGKLKKITHTNKKVAKGKSIDFLSQEILREVNAASSKTKAKRVSWWLVQIKNSLERIREQAQNIE
jgi:uncharacterized protein YicC (UPF0701 family)